MNRRSFVVLVLLVGALFTVRYAEAQPSCVNGIHLDDASFENGYRIPFAADARYLQRFTPSSYPATLTRACACWANTNPASMGFNFIIYDDNGPNGQPGTLLATVPGAVTANSLGALNFDGRDCTNANITITAGSVYVGTQWNAASNISFFICSDISSGTPQATAFNSSNGGLSWTPVQFQDALFRALGIRAVLGPPRATVGGCRSSANVLCLGGGRFRAEVEWRNQFNSTAGRGIAIPRTSLSGFFAFDNPDNVELILKVLDFGNDNIKVFYGQLTDLSFNLRITNTQTGQVEVYTNTPGNCGAIDQTAFQTAAMRTRLNQLIKRNSFAAGTCIPSDRALCLLNNRFRVEATWQNQFNGTSGQAGAVPFTNLSGLLHYGDPNNVELLVKTLDFGGGQILFLYGALSDFGYTITLTDTLTGAVKTYNNPPGNYCGGIDTNVF